MKRPYSTELTQKILSYEDIIFDWNGTLLNDVDVMLKAEQEQFKNYGINPLNAKERAKIFSHPIENYYKNVGFDLSKTSFKQLSIEFMEIYEKLSFKNAQLFEGTIELLDILKNKNKNLYILSAASEKHLQAIVDVKGISSYFKAIYGLHDHEAKTKIPRALELKDDFSELKNSTSLLMVGDTDHDYEVAQAIGADSIIIAQGHQAHDKLKKLNTIVLKNRH